MGVVAMLAGGVGAFMVIVTSSDAHVVVKRSLDKRC